MDRCHVRQARIPTSLLVCNVSDCREKSRSARNSRILVWASKWKVRRLGSVARFAIAEAGPSRRLASSRLSSGFWTSGLTLAHLAFTLIINLLDRDHQRTSPECEGRTASRVLLTCINHKFQSHSEHQDTLEEVGLCLMLTTGANGYKNT